MYKDFSKAEMIVLFSGPAFALLYNILEKHHLHIIPIQAVLIAAMIYFAYMFFNRVIKFIIQVHSMRGHCYETTFRIQSITRRKIRGGSYKVFTGEYVDAENRSHKQQIHNAFSIRQWKTGDEIKIKVSEADPENIIIVFSDMAMAIFMSIWGIMSEAIIIVIYLCINKSK